MTKYLSYFMLAALIAGTLFVVWYFFFSSDEEIGENITSVPEDTGMSIKTTGNVNSNVIVPPSQFGFTAGNEGTLFGNGASQPIYVQARNGMQLTEEEY